MFDIGWQELFVLGVLALILVGPKELPGLLRTIGRYVGVLKKQAAEFRSHFDQALREAELDQLKKDVTGLRQDVEGTLRDTLRAAERQLDTSSSSPGSSSSGTPPAPQNREDAVDRMFEDPAGLDADGFPEVGEAKTAAAKHVEATPSSGGSSGAESDAGRAGEPTAQSDSAASAEPAKTGAQLT